MTNTNRLSPAMELPHGAAFATQLADEIGVCLLTTADLCAAYGLSGASITKYVRLEILPRPLRITPHANLWDSRALPSREEFAGLRRPNGRPRKGKAARKSFDATASFAGSSIGAIGTRSDLSSPALSFTRVASW